jgi:hypothetical protein
MMGFKRYPLFSCRPTLLMFMVFLFLSFGCATKGKHPVEVECPADIEWQVASEAQITQFECNMGTHEKEVALIFKVGIKNVTDKPLQYVLNIFLEDMHKGAGSLIPANGRPLVLEPGKVETVTVPFNKIAEMSKNVLVVIRTIKD